MSTERQSDKPDIQLVGDDRGEITLLIDNGQAMQGWERELMIESAQILCGFGSNFLEVGLGLGISALAIAEHPNTHRHRVIEKYQKVIDIFHERYPSPPSTLQVVNADFFEFVHGLEPESLDGIFFDPYLPPEMCNDETLWNEVVPLMVRALRNGGALVPFFTLRPILVWQFVPFFSRVVVERRPYVAYPTTDYLTTTQGDAFIQCFIKES